MRKSEGNNTYSDIAVNIITTPVWSYGEQHNITQVWNEVGDAADPYLDEQVAWSIR